MANAAYLIYTATIGVSAFLLFLVQPMIAKMILPVFGGGAGKARGVLGGRLFQCLESPPARRGLSVRQLAAAHEETEHKARVVGK